jgi:hypothetical protein
MPVDGLLQKLPAGQIWHTTSAVVVHGVCTYWPWAQLLQVVQLAALEAVEYEVPVPQGRQSVLAVALHAAWT